MKAGELVVSEHCGAATRTGGRCGKPAGWGTDHVGTGRCKLHLGNTATGRRAAQREEAFRAVETYGLPRNVDPHSALLEELARTAGHVAWLSAKVASMPEDDVVDSPWLRLYTAERRHSVEVAAACVKAGIEERRVRLAEQQGQLIARVIEGVLADLAVPAGNAAPLVRKHLALVAETSEVS